jgi:hypothetical protein
VSFIRPASISEKIVVEVIVLEILAMRNRWRCRGFLLLAVGEAESVLIDDRAAMPDCNGKARHVIFVHEGAGEIRHRRPLGRRRLRRGVSGLRKRRRRYGAGCGAC